MRLKLPTSDFRLPTSDSRLPTSDSRLPTPDSRLPTPDFQLPNSEFRIPNSGIQGKDQASDAEGGDVLQVSRGDGLAVGGQKGAGQVERGEGERDPFVEGEAAAAHREAGQFRGGQELRRGQGDPQHRGSHKNGQAAAERDPCAGDQGDRPQAEKRNEGRLGVPRQQDQPDDCDQPAECPARETGRRRGDCYFPQEKRPGKPGEGLQLVDVFYLGAQVVAQGEGRARRPRPQMSQPQRPPGVEVGAAPGKPQMQECAPVEGAVGWEKEPEGPVEGVEDSRLAVRQKRDAHKQVRIPERQPSSPKCPRRLGPVRVEIGEEVPSGDHPSGQTDVPEGQQEQESQDQKGCAVAETIGTDDCLARLPLSHSIRWNRHRKSVFSTVKASFQEIFFPSENSRPV